jgi:hypothetical protein
MSKMWGVSLYCLLWSESWQQAHYPFVTCVHVRTTIHHFAKFIICNMHWIMKKNTRKILLWWLNNTSCANVGPIFAKAKKCWLLHLTLLNSMVVFIMETIFFPWCWHVLPILHSPMLIMFCLCMCFWSCECVLTWGWFYRSLMLEWSILRFQLPHKCLCLLVHVHMLFGLIILICLQLHCVCKMHFIAFTHML